MRKVICLCLLLLVGFTTFAQSFGLVSNSLNPANLKGKEFRYTGQVKFTPADTAATGHLWIRVDLKDGKMGFFENMEKSPIRATNWKQFEITGTIDSDAKDITLGLFIIGKGTLAADKFTFEVKNANGGWDAVALENGGFDQANAEGNPDKWYVKSLDYNFTIDKTNPFEGAGSLLIQSVERAKPVLENGPEILLPKPSHKGDVSVEEALHQRRSIREYANDSLTVAHISQMLWAAYGVSDSIIGRKSFYLKTAPSAGARYPLEIYIGFGKVIGMKPGIYHYSPIRHSISAIAYGDLRSNLDNGQGMVEQAPATLVFTAFYERTTAKYGDRGRERYVCMDLGHAGQNVYLQAVALGMGTCAIASFSDEDVSALLNLKKEESPLYIMPIGMLMSPKE